VVKPATGTRGTGVLRMTPSTPDRAELLADSVAEGHALLQTYLPEAPEGDIRIHVIDGELLVVDGKECAVRRVPGKGEWRSNVALGGHAAPAALDDAHRALVRTVGPLLRAHGLWHVGLDVVGHKVVECNVFSPGGLRDAESFTQARFRAALVERFVAALG
jgi:glutathione synthase